MGNWGGWAGRLSPLLRWLCAVWGGGRACAGASPVSRAFLSPHPQAPPSPRLTPLAQPRPAPLTTHTPPHRVTLVYNSLSSDANKSAKLGVLRSLFTFAAEGRMMELIQPFLASAASWPSKWSLTPEQAGSLYLTVAQCMERCGAAEETQAFLIRYLATLETASEAAIAAALPYAVQAALNFVKAPAISQKSNLSRLAAVSCNCGQCVWGGRVWSAFAVLPRAWDENIGLMPAYSGGGRRLAVLCRASALCSARGGGATPPAARTAAYVAVTHGLRPSPTLRADFHEGPLLIFSLRRLLF